jgi:hypothetical protein
MIRLMSNTKICPECGAHAGACEPRFNEFLAIEFSNPAYGAVHHLTVAAFMLQHSSKLTREGWLYERELLKKFLVNKVLPTKMRELMRDVVDSGKRRFKIASRSGQAVIAKTTWDRTIMDVSTETADRYCEDIASWAASVLQEAQQIQV